MKQDHYKNVGVVILVLLFAGTYPQIEKGSDPKCFFLGVLCFGALMYIFEPLAKLFSNYWMKLGKLMGNINSRIILSIFFIIFLLPMALLKKVFTKKENDESSAWLTIEAEKHNFKNPW